ncbi:hypothetical protein ACFHW2_39895 [Actinomadura sp. LOL_016]|uniref:hypothetical protein n=1 Tax=unclassified Actinomadura TaxID=2626254 RepID=UPI003A7FB6A0
MSENDVLLLLLGVSVALHAATVAGLLTRRAGRGHADSALAAGGAVAATLSLWVATVGLYQ